MNNWYKLLLDEIKGAQIIGVAINGVLYNSLESAKVQLEKPFTGYFENCGVPFTAWTEDRVYFPVTYDGDERIGSAPRNPINEATEHFGGG